MAAEDRFPNGRWSTTGQCTSTRRLYTATVTALVNGYNWLKMYDKFGWVLRIETVINNPREFRVRRMRTRQGRREMGWCPMNKGVINLYRYREVSLAANQRYLEALSVVADPAPAYRQVEELTEPVVVSGRSHAGFNLASKADVKLFAAVLDGNNLVLEFRNDTVTPPPRALDGLCG